MERKYRDKERWEDTKEMLLIDKTQKAKAYHNKRKGTTEKGKQERNDGQEECVWQRGEK